MHHEILHHHLSNGASVLLVPLLGTEAVTTIILMGVGSRYEADTQRGLAHFTEHMVFKGGRTYQTAQAVSQALDAVGGEFNAYTAEEFTGFYTKTDKRHVELGLDVLSDMVLHASFPADELEKEKGVIAEEINMYEDMPMRTVHRVLAQLVFGDTPLGRPVLGTKESTGSFTREDFIAYRKQFYKGGQCTIVIAGAINPEEVKPLVETYFNELPVGESYQAPVAAFQSPVTVALDVRTSEQTHLALAIHGLPLSDPRRYALRILTTILGGNMSSRLFISVREEQGLCYYVRAYTDSMVDTGTVVISAGVDNTRLPQAVEAIIKELQRLRDEPISEAELHRAKQYQHGKLLLSLEDSEDVAEYYGLQYVLEGQIESIEDLEKGIDSVTAKEVQELARQLFISEKLRLAVSGPYSDSSSLADLLHFV